MTGWRVFLQQHRILRRVAVEGFFIWLVLHTILAAMAKYLGGGELYAAVRAAIVAFTGVALWVDLRASRDLLFHANLGLGGRTLLAVGLAPGIVGEVVTRAWGLLP